MKAIKIIVLAALTALAVMAFVSVSSAMGENTTLCSAEGSGCGVTHVHEVGNAKLLTSVITTECEALVLGDVKKLTNTLANPLVLEANFTYSSCTLGGASCTATEENGPAEVKELKEGHENAKRTLEYLVHLVCGKTIDCSFNGVGLVGTVKGPLLSTEVNGETTFSEQSTVKEAGGLLCAKNMKIDITTTPLSATYISS